MYTTIATATRQRTWQNMRMKNAAAGSVIVSLHVMMFPGMAPCSGTIAVSTTTAWGRFRRMNSPVGRDPTGHQ